MDVLRNKKEIKNYLGTNENKSKMIQNQQDAAKALLRRKFIAIKSYLSGGKKISENLTLHLKELEKGEQQQKSTHKFSRRKEIIQFRTEISETKQQQ